MAREQGYEYNATAELSKLYLPKHRFLSIHQNFLPPLLPAIRYIVVLGCNDQF